jgi:hypothetical protein
LGNWKYRQSAEDIRPWPPYDRVNTCDWGQRGFWEGLPPDKLYKNLLKYLGKAELGLVNWQVQIVDQERWEQVPM